MNYWARREKQNVSADEHYVYAGGHDSELRFRRGCHLFWMYCFFGNQFEVEVRPAKRQTFHPQNSLGLKPSGLSCTTF